MQIQQPSTTNSNENQQHRREGREVVPPPPPMTATQSLPQSQPPRKNKNISSVNEIIDRTSSDSNSTLANKLVNDDDNVIPSPHANAQYYTLLQQQQQQQKSLPLQHHNSKQNHYMVKNSDPHNRSLISNSSSYSQYDPHYASLPSSSSSSINSSYPYYHSPHHHHHHQHPLSVVPSFNNNNNNNNHNHNHKNHQSRSNFMKWLIRFVMMLLTVSVASAFKSLFKWICARPMIQHWYSSSSYWSSLTTTNNNNTNRIKNSSSSNNNDNTVTTDNSSINQQQQQQDNNNTNKKHHHTNNDNHNTTNTTASHEKSNDQYYDIIELKLKMKYLEDQLSDWKQLTMKNMDHHHHQLPSTLSSSLNNTNNNNYMNDRQLNDMKMELSKMKSLLKGYTSAARIQYYHPPSVPLTHRPQHVQQQKETASSINHHSHNNNNNNNNDSNSNSNNSKTSNERHHDAQMYGYSESYDFSSGQKKKQKNRGPSSLDHYDHNNMSDSGDSDDSLGIGKRINAFEDDTQSLMNNMYNSNSRSLLNNTNNKNSVVQHHTANIQTVFVEPSISSSALSNAVVNSAQEKDSSVATQALPLSTDAQQNQDSPATTNMIERSDEEFDYGMFDGTIPSFDDLFTSASSVAQQNQDHPWMKNLLRTEEDALTGESSNVNETADMAETDSYQSNNKNDYFFGQSDEYQELDSSQSTFGINQVQPFKTEDSNQVEELTAMMKQTEQSTPKFQNSKLFKLFEKIGSGDVSIDDNNQLVNMKAKKKRKSTVTVNKRKKKVPVSDSAETTPNITTETAITTTMETTETVETLATGSLPNVENQMPREGLSATEYNPSTNAFEVFDTYDFDNDERYQNLLKFTEMKGTLQSLDTSNKAYALLKLKAKYYTKHFASEDNKFDFAEYCQARNIDIPSNMGSTKPDDRASTGINDQAQVEIAHTSATSMIDDEGNSIVSIEEPDDTVNKKEVQSVEESNTTVEASSDTDVPRYPDSYMTTLQNLTQGIMPSDVKIIETTVNPNVIPTASKMVRKLKPWERKKIKEETVPANESTTTIEPPSATANNANSVEVENTTLNVDEQLD